MQALGTLCSGFMDMYPNSVPPVGLHLFLQLVDYLPMCPFAQSGHIGSIWIGFHLGLSVCPELRDILIFGLTIIGLSQGCPRINSLDGSSLVSRTQDGTTSLKVASVLARINAESSLHPFQFCQGMIWAGFQMSWVFRLPKFSIKTMQALFPPQVSHVYSLGAHTLLFPIPHLLIGLDFHIGHIVHIFIFSFYTYIYILCRWMIWCFTLI